LYAFGKNLHQTVGTLSGGELKYLEVFVILHMNHPFILMDEPFSGIEPLFEDEISRLISMNPHRKGIMLTDHRYQNVLNDCNRLCLLKDGALKRINNVKDLEMAGYVPSGTF
jgi:lipopolysaccharide export system ATP-binding protein